MKPMPDTSEDMDEMTEREQFAWVTIFGLATIGGGVVIVALFVGFYKLCNFIWWLLS